MSLLGKFVGLAAGQNAYKPAELQTPATTQQAIDAYNQSQAAYQQQQDFLNALQGQQGIANQSNVYNQLQDVVAGQGPNPAQAMLANATGANTANQAALMASQRGASANPALIARMAAQQGAANQQNAVGQAAALQAQQSLNALGQAGALANQQVAQQQNATQFLNQAAQGQQGLTYNQINAQNQGRIANSQIEAGIAAQNAKGMQGLVQGVSQAVGGGLGQVLGGGGGKFMQGATGTVPAGAEGGEVSPGAITPPASGPSSNAAKFLSGLAAHMNQGGEVYTAAKGAVVPGKAVVKGDSLKNDKVPAVLSAGEIVIPRSISQGKDAPKRAAEFVAACLAKKGKVPSKK